MIPGHSASAKRQRRQHEEAQIADRVFIERHVTGRRQPVQLDREQVDQEDRGQECRHRQHAEGAAGHETVERAAAAHRAGDREREHRSRAPGSRPRTSARAIPAAARDTACNTVCPVRNDRPKSPSSTWPSQLDVTPPDRLIEPHVMAQRRDFIRRRLIAQDHVGEIARQQRGDQEGQQRYGDQNRHQVKEPSGDEAQHATVIPSRRSDTSITPL